MDVKKIFIILITVVACIMVGAFILNTIMPNVLATAFNAVDGAIYNATGISLDLNGDGLYGNDSSLSNAINKGTNITSNAKADKAGMGDIKTGNNVAGYRKK